MTSRYMKPVASLLALDDRERLARGRRRRRSLRLPRADGVCRRHLGAFDRRSARRFGEGATTHRPLPRRSARAAGSRAVAHAAGSFRWVASCPAKAGPATLPPPTPAQMSAYQALQKEIGAYESDAKDYRSTLTMIVKHHYDEKRQRVLSALDRDIDVEQKGLSAARDEAIRRLEKFVATYSGANANVEATPDAMYRLAALYEERARADFEGDLSKSLKPAISLYRRIIREYPKYEEIAGVYYFLGHAYTDSSRLAEGQQAWRALVCNDQYSVTDDPTDSDKIAVQPLVQNHDDKFWNDWYNRHPIPLDQVGGGGRRSEGRAPATNHGDDRQEAQGRAGRRRAPLQGSVSGDLRGRRAGGAPRGRPEVRRGSLVADR